MKRITIIISAFLIFGLQSCTDFLDIRPENETVLEDYWQSESQATAVLSSCYRGLTTDACIERMIVWGELRSDNVIEGNSTRDEIRKILEVNITPTNGYANWGSFYSVINYCNTFLHYAPNVLKTDQNFTPTKLHSLEAEALGLRAMCYFYLVRAFKEVPLILNPSINDTQDYYVPKSSERAILDQIIADLLEAQKYARTDFGKGSYNKGRITLNAINALLADVYLWDQQYSNCVETCNRILDDKTLSLVSGDKTLTDVFYTGNSTESIFELQFDKDIQYNNTVNFFYGYEGRRDVGGELYYPKFLTRTGEFSPFNYAASSVKESEKDIRETSSYSPTTTGNGYNIYKYALIQNVENADGLTYTPKY
ncbi:MAG TPA: RagB/SusD family nutrient uptake outer membrane protein, partial [Paludibacter sp.]